MEDLKKLLKNAMSVYKDCSEFNVSEREFDEDFEEFWNDEDTQLAVKKIKDIKKQ